MIYSMVCCMVWKHHLIFNLGVSQQMICDVIPQTFDYFYCGTCSLDGRGYNKQVGVSTALDLEKKVGQLSAQQRHL